MCGVVDSSSVTVYIAVFVCLLSLVYEWTKPRKERKNENRDFFEEKGLITQPQDEVEAKVPVPSNCLTIADIPGPPPTEGLGNLLDIAAAGSYYAFLTDIHERYGIIAKFYVQDKVLVSLADPELFRKTARTSNRPAELFEAFSPLMTKDSLAFMNGSEGRKRHTIFEVPLSHQCLPNYVDGLQSVADELVHKWKTLGSGSTVSLKDYTLSLAMKCILNMLFGEYFEKHEELIIPMQQNYDFCWSELERQSVGDVPGEDSDRATELIRRRDEIFRIVGDCVAYRRENPPEPGDEKMIDVVMNYFNNEDEVSTKAELVNMIVGAYLSTGDILTWIFYFVSKHQDAQAKIYDEIKDILGDSPLTFDALPHLKYLKQFVDECLRASLLGTFVARESEHDMVLEGYHIPPGVTLVQAMGVVHMDPKYFPDPTRFDPDRFSEENTKKRPPYSFVPFGFAGGRKCPGFRFAYLACMELVGTAIRNFETSYAPDKEDPEVVHGLISFLKGDVEIIIKDRTRR